MAAFEDRENQGRLAYLRPNGRILKPLAETKYGKHYGESLLRRQLAAYHGAEPVIYGVLAGRQVTTPCSPEIRSDPPLAANNPIRCRTRRSPSPGCHPEPWSFARPRWSWPDCPSCPWIPPDLPYSRGYPSALLRPLLSSPR